MFEKKDRYSHDPLSRGYRDEAASEISKETSDSHFSFETGTEGTSLDTGSSGSTSKKVDNSLTVWYSQDIQNPDYNYTERTVTTYTEDSSSSYNSGVVLGSDDTGVTNEGKFNTNISASEETHWMVDGASNTYVIAEIYRNSFDSEADDNESGSNTPAADSGDDVDPDDDGPIHRITEQYSGDGVDDDSVNIILEETPQGPFQDNLRTLDDILAEYLDRKTQLERLKAALALETDPDKQKYLQDQIDVQTDILGDLTDEALAAGATQADLDGLDSNAGAAAASDPIEQQEWYGGDSGTWTMSWFFPALSDTFWDGRAFDSVLGAINQTADVVTFDYFDFTQYGSYYGHEDAFQLGQPMGNYAGGSLLAAAAVWAWPATGGGTFAIGVGPGAGRLGIHFVAGSRVGTGAYVCTEYAGLRYAWNQGVVMQTTLQASEVRGVFSGIPILFPVSAASRDYCINCLTHVFGAFRAGIFGR